MPRFFTSEPRELLTTALVEALDPVDFGVLLLSPDFKLRFMNRRQHEIWKLPLRADKDCVTFRDLLEQVADADLYPLTSTERLAFIDEREAEMQHPSGTPRTIDLMDGRRFVVSCKVTPEGGRMLTYVEETALRQLEIRQLEQAAARDAEMRFQTELLESHGAQLATLAESAGEAASQAIEANARLAQEAEERKLLMVELERLATTDQLTGLLNRGQFIKRATTIIKDSLLQAETAAVIMLDIDHFKLVNDQYGHAAGDAVLRIVAERLTDELRAADVFGRLGGEEFAAVLPAVSGRTANKIAERLRACVADHVIWTGDHVLRVTISVGIAMLRESNIDINTLLTRADSALYQAKRSGRNRVCGSIDAV